MAIVTVDEVQAVSGKTFSADERVLVAELIDEAQADVESFLGRHVEVQEITEYHNLPPFELNINLTDAPVQSVTSVKINGELLASDQYWISRWGITFSNWGYTSLILNPASWVAPTASYEIIYVGGLDGTKLPDIKNVIKRVVLREKARVAEGDYGRLGYTEVRVEDFMARKGSVSGANSPDANNYGSLNKADQQMITKYRWRSVLSNRMTPPDPLFYGSGYGYGYGSRTF